MPVFLYVIHCYFLHYKTLALESLVNVVKQDRFRELERKINALILVFVNTQNGPGQRTNQGLLQESDKTFALEMVDVRLY